MKRIINITVLCIIAIAFNTNISAQNNKSYHGNSEFDSITALNQPQGIMLNGQTDDLPKNDLSQPPSTIIQKNNYYDIRILPETTGDLIYIENAEIQSCSELFDVNGNLLFKKYNHTSHFTLNTSALKRGNYILVIRSKNHQISKKIAIK